MKVFKCSFTIALLATLVACGNDESTEATEHKSHDTASTTGRSTSTASASLKDDRLNAVYQHYIHLTTALTNSDVAEAKIAANAIEAGAREMENGETIASFAATITASNDIEIQRAAYSKLSNQVIELVKKSGLNSGELYVEYCPMAFNDKGAYWLSNTREIRNPYFGEKMMTCGEVKETIK